MMNTLRLIALTLTLVATASCSILEGPNDRYGYSWMTVNDVAFGMGDVDQHNGVVEGLACRVQGNRSLYSELEFRYVVYHDANDDGRFQPSEMIAEDRQPFAAGADEVHVQNLNLKQGGEKIRIQVAAYDQGRKLAGYEGGFAF